MSMPRLDRVAGGSPAPRHRHFPAQYLFALLAGCLFNLSHLLRLVRARVAQSLKGFSELANTTRAACTLLSRKASVRGVSVMVWKQLTTRCKYVIYKKHTRTRRKRPRAEPAPARRSADGP